MAKKKKKNFNYLRKLKNELEEVSKKHDIDIELLKTLIDEMFYDIRVLIVSPKMPVVTLSSFGTFRPSFFKINFLLARKLRFLRNRKKFETQRVIQATKKEISRYWAVKQRYIAERRGIRTWKCWSDLGDDLKDYQECHRATYKNCLKCRRNGTVFQTQDSSQET
jgi:hypothetical protein